MGRKPDTGKMELKPPSVQMCRSCGRDFFWAWGARRNLDNSTHMCKPKVKVFSKEEIAEMNKERGND